MKPDSTSQTFRSLAQQVRDQCQRRGIQLHDGGAESILADRINAVARKLRVSDHHAMRAYITDDLIAQIVDLCVQAHARHQTEVELASPMLLPIPHAATVIAALAASCEAATTAAHRNDTTVAVREASAAILRIAAAIARAGDTAHAILEAETAVITRTQLSTMLEHLTDGTWHMPGHEPLPDAREHDLAMRDHIARDLKLLE